MPEAHASTRVITTDLSRLDHDIIHRPRPHPWDIEETITVTDGGAPDTFGAYVECIAKEHYDFGDSPNRVMIVAICICNISVNGAFLIEFSQFDGVSTYTPLGAIRFARLDVFSRSFIIRYPCHDFDNDTYSLVARVKSSTGGGDTVSFGLHVSRHINTSREIGLSTGTFPTG